MADISFYSKEKHSAEVLTLLRQKLPQHRVHHWPDLECDANNIDYAVCWHPPEAFFQGAEQVKAIFSLAAGVDHLLSHRGLPPDVPIVRLVDAGMGDKIAEYVHYAVLGSHRGFDRYRLLQQENLWQVLPDRHRGDYRVGVLGYGAIGRCIAMKLHNEGYSVSAFRRSNTQVSDPFPVLSGDINAFLSELDTLVSVLPLTDKTKGMINSTILSSLPKGAQFINVGRGNQVNEQDLADALNSGQLGSAMIDVCSEEPLPPEHPLWNVKNLAITPHIAGPTQTALSVEQVATSILALESGTAVSELPGLVDMTLGY